MKNIDDMRVGDFLYLLDCMQEECCQHKRCEGCRYIDFCHVNMPSIDSLGIRITVEGYAEANGLLEHMHYVNDQKWISVNDRLPEDGESVLTYEDQDKEICLLKDQLNRLTDINNNLWNLFIEQSKQIKMLNNLKPSLNELKPNERNKK